MYIFDNNHRTRQYTHRDVYYTRVLDNTGIVPLTIITALNTGIVPLTMITALDNTGIVRLVLVIARTKIFDVCDLNGTVNFVV